MKKSLLAIVQDILSDMNSDEVNSISDSVEAEQVARIVASTYDSFVAQRVIPEHKQLMQLTALADSTRPNYLKLPSNVRFLEKFKYKTDSNYKDVQFEDQESFLDRVTRRDASASNVVSVPDVSSNVTLLIYNDKRPQWYTSFDDEHIVCDSYDASVESTLQEANTMAMALVDPSEFLIEDSFVPDIDSTLFPTLIQEAKSMCLALLSGGPNQKVEQTARRNLVKSPNDLARTVGKRKLVNYGR